MYPTPPQLSFSDARPFRGLVFDCACATFDGCDRAVRLSGDEHSCGADTLFHKECDWQLKTPMLYPKVLTLRIVV
jgi:hypothetical protein